jgi:hypothetical protein
MEDKELTALESYVLAEDRQSQLENLVPGSFLHSYLAFTRLLAAGDLTAIKQQDLLAKLAWATKDSAIHSQIDLAFALKNIELETDPAALQMLLESFNSKFLHFNFNYAKPFLTQISGLATEVLLPSTLPPPQLPFDQAHLVPDVFVTFSPLAYPRFEVSRMSDAVFLEFVQRAPLVEFPAAIPRLAEVLVSRHLFSILKTASLAQLEQLLQISPELAKHHEFILVKLAKKYPDLTGSDPIDLYDLQSIYVRLLHDLSSLPASYKSCEISVRRQLLLLSLELGEYDFALFQDYLKAPLRSPFSKAGIDASPAHFFAWLFKVKDIPEEVLLRSYFEEIFSTQDTVKPYDDYVEASALSKIFAKARVLSGVPASHFSDVLDISDVQSIIEKVELEFSKTCRKAFSREEGVVVQLKFKNVQRLIVRLYGLNTTAYYLKHHAQIKTDIDLDGLIPSSEQLLQFDSDPLVRRRLDLTIPDLENKAGVFVLELIGNGRSTRAVIKKGSLKCVTRLTAAGTVVKVLDETNSVCNHEGAGVYLDGRFYSTNNPNGQVVLPFAQSRADKQLTLTDGLFSELYDHFDHQGEAYELRAVAVIPQEACVKGTRAKIAVRPQLFVNSVKAPSTLLTNVSLTINTVSKDGLPASKAFNDFAFLEGSDDLIELEFEVPCNLISVSVNMKAEVQPVSRHTKQQLHWEFTQQQGLRRAGSLHSGYLRLTSEGFLLEVRGVDGALKDGLEVLVMTRSQLASGHRSSETLRTKDGVVRLGNLDDASELLARLGSEVFVWDIDHFRPKTQYPQQIQLCEGDEFTLPLTRPFKTGESYVLYSVYNSSVIEALDKVTLDNEALELTLGGLEKGSYMLKFQDKAIPMTVYEGAHWGNNQFILTDNVVVSTPSQYRAFAVRSVVAVDSSIKVQMNGDYSKAKVHLYLSSFLTSSMLQPASEMAKLQESQLQTVRVFPSAKNIYLDSRVLDEELRYTIERKQLEKVMGNTLPRPQLALKRMELAATTTETQQAAAGSEYLSKPMDLSMSQDFMFDAYHQQSSASRLPDTSSTVDFLACPAVLICNLAPDEHGVAEISGVDFSAYSSVLVTATNPECVATFVSALGGTVELTSLTHKVTSDFDKAYAEQLKSSAVRAGETFVVKDAASQLKVIDSVEKQLSLINEISKAAGKPALAWAWLGGWDRLSADEKARKFDEFASHELNLFLKAKDPGFFGKVVRPFLSAKFEKSFVDKWLLEESLEEYLDAFTSLSNQGTRLNALEMALLVQAIRSTHPETAAQIVQVMEEIVRAQPRNEEERRRLFSTVLNFELKESNTSVQENLFGGFGLANASAPPQQNLFGAPMMEMMQPQAMQHRGMGTFAVAMPAYADPFSAMIPHPPPNLCDFGSADLLSLDDIIESRQSVKPYYEKLDSTKEYAETHYFGVKDPATFRTLLPISDFYAELARSFLDNKLTVLSESFLKSTLNPTDSYAALAFTDLPFTPSRHGFIPQDRGYQLEAQSNFIVFHKSIEEVQPQLSESILVAQKYFDPNDRVYIAEDGETEEKLVSQFVIDKAYGCQVIISNTSVRTYSADVVYEVPEGSIPITELDYSAVKSVVVSPYSTVTLQFHFYFPRAGTYRHFPANVAVRGVVKAVARTQLLTVQDRPSLEHLETFKDVIASGNAELIVKAVKEKNLFVKGFALEDILWLARDPAMYAALIEVFRSKRTFDPRLWAFSMVHCDLQAFSELLCAEHRVTDKLSINFQSTLLPLKRTYRHLDYFPLVNARAHKLGTKARITNSKFKSVYKQFLIQAAEKDVLETYDYVAFAHYLVLQDRISEAKALVDTKLTEAVIKSRGQSAGVAPSLQLDYIRAYLDLPNAGPIAEKYTAYPVKAWRDLFAQVSKQLAEAAEVSEYHEDIKEDEPDLVFKVEQGGVVKLDYTGLTEAWLSLYEVDLEVLFCRNPFFSYGNQDFSFVTPNFKVKLQLDPEARRTSVSLPEQYASKNVLIEIESKGVKKAASHFATSLKVQVLELYGQVKVSSPELRPLPLTYVKAFARLKTGEIQFYKDGYTDIRGRFDFVSLNTNLLKSIEKFALFVEHEEYGSLTAVADPPPQ